MKALILAPFAVLLGAGIAFAAPVKTMKTAKGAVLAGENGMTLYTFKKDKHGESACYDMCATNWPPLIAASGAKADGAYSLVPRKDGTKQWAKDGMPLYYWAKDMKAGDTTGDGVNGVWNVAKP